MQAGACRPHLCAPFVGRPENCDPLVSAVELLERSASLLAGRAVAGPRILAKHCCSRCSERVCRWQFACLALNVESQQAATSKRCAPGVALAAPAAALVSCFGCRRVASYCSGELHTRRRCAWQWSGNRMLSHHRLVSAKFQQFGTQSSAG